MQAETFTVETLEKLRDDARLARQKSASPEELIVLIPEGDYFLSRPFQLKSEDSAPAESRTIFRGQGKVRFHSGKIVDNWIPVTNEKTLAVLPESVRGKVFQANLSDLGMNDFASPDRRGAELFFDNKPMTIARYPNEGFIKITEVFGEEKNVRGTKGSSDGKFVCGDSRIGKWVNEKEPWVSGYWFWDWAEGKQRVDKIDPARNYLELKDPQHSYGYRKGQWFYGFNLLCELDAPGEYYIDREKGILYFYPPVENLSQLKQKEAFLTMGQFVLALTDVKGVSVENVIMEGCRFPIINVRNSNHIILKDLVLRNSGDAAIVIHGGSDGLVDNCEAYGMGSAGICVNAGDRKSLTPGGWVIQNCFVHHYARIGRMYNPGIQLNGCGNTARHNLITDAPHNAMTFSGNNHLMEYNELARVCWESNDAGAVYTGRNWTMRGNVFRYNYMHDVQGFQNKGCVGIYLDDMFSSCRIEGNVFQRVTRAAMIGGGRDNQLVNNIFIDCVPSLHVDARGLGWAKFWSEQWLQEQKDKGTLMGIAFDKPPYSEQYPELANMLSGQPAAPEGNEISRNICYGGVWDKPAGFWKTSIHPQARPFLKMEDNTVWVKSQGSENQWEGENPLFVNPEKPEAAQFQLQPDSPALKNGFKPIPFEKIGRGK